MKQLGFECRDFQLISGGGVGGDDGRHRPIIEG
jgi:hypothetical protein